VDKTLKDIGEFGLIDRIQTIIEGESPESADIRLGIGDDAASFRPKAGYEILVTCDSVVEGRHFLPEHISPLDLGRRAMSLNISDIGAMGGRPLYALISLGLRGDSKVSYIEELYRGFLRELTPMGGAIIGGNLTKVENEIFIDITLIGEVEEGRAVRRSGAREGDVILLTGYPGESAAGLHYLLSSRSPGELTSHPLVRRYNTPTHRAREGRVIALTGLATSMIDTSDGFLGDLGHICKESRLGALILEERLPVSEDIKNAARLFNIDPFEWVLGSSDDYELIITCPPEHLADIKAALRDVSDVPIHEVGRMLAVEEGIRLQAADGNFKSLSEGGWDHFIK